MTQTIKIAIDGPSGAGKSTISRELARRLGFDYIDTGAMYRAVGYKMRQNGISADDEQAIAQMLANTDLDYRSGIIYLDGENVEKKIRTRDIAMAASECSALPVVREKLIALQRKIGRRRSCILDGRDIGTNVFRDAQFKFFLTASSEERAARRFRDLKQAGDLTDYDSLLEEIKTRDYDDSHRMTDPLRKADDAIEIDSTNMTIDEVVDIMWHIIKDSGIAQSEISYILKQ